MLVIELRYADVPLKDAGYKTEDCGHDLEVSPIPWVLCEEDENHDSSSAMLLPCPNVESQVLQKRKKKTNENNHHENNHHGRKYYKLGEISIPSSVTDLTLGIRIWSRSQYIPPFLTHLSAS